MEAESNHEPQPQAEQVKSMETLLEKEDDYAPPKPGEIRTATVIEIGADGALVDIGFKREGFVSQDDLQKVQGADMEEVQEGEEVPVLILRPTTGEGYLPVSIHKARLAEDWLQAEELLESGEIFEAEISGYNRGGLTVQFGKIRGFIPLSHVVGIPRHLQGEKRRERLKKLVGREVGLKVIEVNRQRRRLILSQRRAYRAWQEMRKRELLEELQEGEHRRGSVTGLTDFGAFVDLGGADGLVHISELSWGRIDHPREVVGIGDEVEVVVLEVNRKRGRISLSLKETQEDPWKSVDESYHRGDLVEGKVTHVADIGAFVELEPGIEGLLHVSELVGAPAVKAEEVVHAGDEVLLKVIRVEKDRRRIGLSARRVRREEWERWTVERRRREAEAVEAAEEEDVPLAEEAETEPAEEVVASEGEIEAVEPAEEEEETPSVDEAEAAESVREVEKGSGRESEAAEETSSTDESEADEPDQPAEEEESTSADEAEDSGLAADEQEDEEA
ncbi:MAG: S1 RNA-binding domain-containing protein [Anaerolineae bacterium]|jgi:small subunit ribosomal protein S1